MVKTLALLWTGSDGYCQQRCMGKTVNITEPFVKSVLLQMARYTHKHSLVEKVARTTTLMKEGPSDRLFLVVYNNWLI